jgi:ubiquinone/menaquinone biosynthesis C-methylase UbiE
LTDNPMKTAFKETFDAVSDGYDSKALKFFPASSEHLASLLALRGDEHVLDVCTGTGHAALALAGRLPRGRVIGVDFSSGMLNQARKKAAELNFRNVEFIEMDMQTLEFGMDQFDAATCAFGIFFVEDMEAQLARIAAKVKPGGTVAICNFRDDYFYPQRDLMIKRLADDYDVPLPPQPWKRIATEEGCKTLFEIAGIRNVRVEQRNMGYFLDDEQEWWNVIWNAGFRRMVSQLKPLDQERFRRKHLEDVAALKTKDGIWLDINVLFTVGQTNNTDG